MDAVVIKPRTKSDARLLRTFSKRIGAKIIDTDELFEDLALGRLIEEGLKDPEFISREEIMEILGQ